MLIESEFRSPPWLPGGHLQTLVPLLLRAFSPVGHPVSIPLRDGDRLAADFYSAASGATHSLIIVSHGLEGSARDPYVLGLCQQAQLKNYDVLAWNLRGCGTVDNVLPKLYYAGCSDDLAEVIEWALRKNYREIYLAGYSLGGSITLKWLGEQGGQAQRFNVRAACVASVPVDLQGCVTKLDSWENGIYRRYFLAKMKRRLRRKAEKFPADIDLALLQSVNNLQDYEAHFSAPLNGFGSVKELQTAISANRVLANITVPTLLVNAANDPFLSESCFPRAIALQHSALTLDIPSSGGHLGFLDEQHQWWLDQRFLQFFCTAH